MSITSSAQTGTTGLPTSMKAWQWTSCDSTLEKAIRLANSIPLPTTKKDLGPGECLIEVYAAALNPVDYKLAELPIVGRMAIPKPAIPGLDYSGRVIKTGSDSNVKVGQMVFGKLEPKQQYGTLGEYIIVSKAGVVPLPEGVTAEQGATLGVCGLVTYQSLAPNVTSGDKVFINGGSGGTGTFAIQIAKALGCYVTTTCSDQNIQLCKSLGADEVIDYRKIDVASALSKPERKFDFVLDNVGTPSELYWKSPDYTKVGARYVQIGSQVSFSFIYDLAFRFLVPTWLGGGRRPFSFGFASTHPEDYAKLANLVAKKQVLPVIDRIFDFEDVPRAYAYLKEGHAKGKVVVQVKSTKK